MRKRTSGGGMRRHRRRAALGARLRQPAASLLLPEAEGNGFARSLDIPYCRLTTQATGASPPKMNSDQKQPLTH